MSTRDQRPLLVRALRLPTGGRVLEVGCGSGATLVELNRLLRPASLVGADVDLALLKEAAARMAATGVDADLLHADVHALPIENGALDLVIDFGTCYHIAGSRAALQEIARVLRPGGLLVHETPLSQLLAHPVRSFCQVLPWSDIPAFTLLRTAVLMVCTSKGCLIGSCSVRTAPRFHMSAPTAAQSRGTRQKR